MKEIILEAMARSEKPRKIRNTGFIPGVLNDYSTASTSVQFESGALNKIIAKHGSNAKVWVVLDNEKKFGFMKEVQRSPVEGKIIHVAIQLVSKDQDVKMQLPINFHGHNELEHKLMQLQVYKPELEVMGKAVLIPDEAIVDVTDKNVGDTITVVDFHLPKGIKILDAADEIYAIIKAAKEEIVEEPEAAVPASE